jgi:hypothetical protein
MRCLFTTAALLALAAPAGTADKPNVVILFADDHRQELRLAGSAGRAGSITQPPA